jgi:hypothetical protein|tara:strand:+ start:3943 stop:4302 length:360 start_codon:yes stop_codon:yes gene_type:complete
MRFFWSKKVEEKVIELRKKIPKEDRYNWGFEGVEKKVEGIARKSAEELVEYIKVIIKEKKEKESKIWIETLKVLRKNAEDLADNKIELHYFISSNYKNEPMEIDRIQPNSVFEGKGFKK